VAGVLSRGAAAALALLIASPPAAGAETRFAALEADGALIVFTEGKLADAERVEVEGASGKLIGIDVRPADGRLYGVTTANDLVTLDPATGAAKVVSTLTAPFDGDVASGVDFNPQADRLRLLGANGRNLRANVDLGAVAADPAPAYARSDEHAGKTPALTACAYTRNVKGAPTTKLFDVDTAFDTLVLQEPANDGVLTTVGKLGIDFGARGGLDIATDAGGIDHAYAVTGPLLFGIDLATGAAKPLGTVAGAGDLIGLAVLPGAKPATAAAPEPHPIGDLARSSTVTGDDDPRPRDGDLDAAGREPVRARAVGDRQLAATR
jgi:hypothetical protein